MEFPQKAIKREDGFSILELLLAIALLGIGLLALGTVSGNVMNKNSDSKKKTVAVSLAQEKLEDVRNQALAAALTNGTTTENNVNDLGVAGSGIYTRVTVITGGGSGSLGTVTVTVTWTDKVARSVELTTKILQ